jgi:NRAMP (natural resistance-associated macrophage protein)-like metal ion transporter
MASKEDREKPLHADVASVRRALGAFGPGIITGASDDDPSGIGTYAQVGAQFGYTVLWTTLVTFPLKTAVQYMCAKIALATGRGMAGVLDMRFRRAIVVPAVLVLVAANTINVGVDIGAIAAAIELLVPIPGIVMIVPITIAIIVLLVWGSYELIDRIFKWLSLALLAYIASALFANPDWGQVLTSTLLPTIQLDAPFLVAMVAIFGTTISPYLFFYQAEDEIEAEVKQGRTTVAQRKHASGKGQLQVAGLDVASGMLFSSVVMYFIYLATAATLHESGQTHISSAAQAAQALEPIAGPAATILLALGLIGSGMLATPILAASASYAVAEAFNWRAGLGWKPSRAKRFYGLIVVGMLIGMLVNFLGIDPISALFWAAVLNGLAAPPLLWLILIVANDRKLMGERTNGRLTNLLGVIAATLMSLLAVAWIVLLVLGKG